MTTHAHFAPSASKRWLYCTASPAEEAKAPDLGSVYASRGTDLHDLAYLKLTKPKASSIKRKTAQFADDQIGLQSVDAYVSLVQERIAERPGTIARYEIRTLWLPRCGGTSDCVLIKPRDDGRHDLEIIDFKAGLGVRVAARENTQLMIYAFGVMAHYEAAFDWADVTLTIAQTGMEDGVDSWTMRPVDVEKWQAKIRATVEKIEAGETSYRPHDSKEICGWCNAKNVCPARTAGAVQAAKDDFAHLLQATSDEGVPSPVAAEELTWEEKLRIAPVLASIAKEWMAGAKRLLLSGEIQVEGKAVVAGSRSRDWTPEGKKKAKRLLEKWGFEETDLYSEPNFLSPSQADTLVNQDKATAKERKAELEKCFSWKDGAPTIVDADKVGKKTVINAADLARQDFAEHLEEDPTE